jgi:signal peptidase I
MQEDRETEPVVERSRAWAVVGSLVVPGLGHWYLGNLRQAVAIAGLYLLAISTLVVLIVALDRGLVLVMWLVIGAACLLRGLVAVHAGMAAKHMQSVVAAKIPTVRGYVGFVVLVMGLGHLASAMLRERVLETSVVPSSSGRPNIEAGDHIVVTKLTTRDREARRGDLVTFKAPGDTAVFVKRVVAIEGESVSVDGGIVSIDGLVLATSPCESTVGLALAREATCLRERTPEGVSYPIQLTRTFRGGPEPVVVPPGHVFVVGDDRLHSHDSRHFGPVSIDAITGRARAVWRPVGRTSSLDP